MADTSEQPEPVLDIERHLRYWKMCLQSPLPRHYLSNEGNRMALAYFMVNSVCILTPAASQTQENAKPLIIPEDRRKIRQWVLSHQQPGGGFAASSSLVFPVKGYEQWQSETGAQEEIEGPGLANLPATLFALQILALLADEGNEAGAFSGVDRVQTLRWLRRLQREDGSFGEVLKLLPGHGWFIAGGYDMRYCYIAAAIRWMLRGDVREGQPEWVEDFDTERLVKYILSSQTYDGGFAGSSQEEPHAGYAYCAISALSLLDRPVEDSTAPHRSEILHSGIRNMPGLIHWLSSRQFVYLEPEPPANAAEYDERADDDEEVNFLLPKRLSDLSLSESLRYVACNGRCNKVADTCYTWWVAGALVNLGKGDLLDWPPSRRFLLEKMAHRIGGFGKHPGGPPDVYHSCFGLTALAVMGEPGLNELDSALVVPTRTARVIERARAALLRRGSEDGRKLAAQGVELGLAMRGARPAWLGAGGGG
ncbi:terpenoid cyclases/protein prenyltransferase alpha-alpha toroid [Achaetomium macrosporum]|uniref:Terpenoid cyclases/protein prenyltransferase alpha-alpha toroid n=1 Tax=Achaetomium macrosporum TaxID=79813 RepID=A0AAN7CHJ8_9PEZI|nr:terpenoid cyclases/protein prenyltransferase alpha-alpha toroid [Achaetomium macrosporum]